MCEKMKEVSKNIGVKRSRSHSGWLGKVGLEEVSEEVILFSQRGAHMDSGSAVYDATTGRRKRARKTGWTRKI